MRPIPDLRTALAFVAILALTYPALGGLLAAAFGEPGLLVAQWLLLLLPALALVRRWRFEPRDTLYLRAPTLRQGVGAVVLMLGAMPLVWWLAWTQTWFLDVPREMLERLQALATAENGWELAWLLLLVAVTPAVCEEVVFRGVLLSGSRRLSAARAVGLNALVFGLFHLSLESPIRFLPSAVLGGLLAWATLRTRSIGVAMIMHLTNNAVLVLMASLPSVRDWLPAPDAPPSLRLLASGAVMALVGVGILRPTQDGRRPSSDPNLQEP